MILEDEALVKTVKALELSTNHLKYLITGKEQDNLIVHVWKQKTC